MSEPHEIDPPERGDPAEESQDPDRVDELLVAAAQQGDQAALGELLQRHDRLIFAVSLRMLGDREVARDLSQACMLRVIENLHQFDGRARFSTWLTRVTMNLCLSHLRKERLRRHASLDAGGSGEEGPSLSAQREQIREPGPAGGVEEEEQFGRLEGAMSRLDAEQRAILILRDVRGLDYKQIAEVLDVAVGTVKSRLFRARTALREEMERSGPDV